MKHDDMSRREFMKKSAECAAYAAVGVTVPAICLGGEAADKLPDLVVANGSPAPATRAAVKCLGGMKAFVKSGDRVVIKPNMSMPNPPEMATTTP